MSDERKHAMSKVLVFTTEMDRIPTKLLNLLDTDPFHEIGAYGDNGGDPDGNAWLPSEPVTCDEIVEAGSGEYVNAHYMDIDDMAELLRIKDVLHLARDTEDWGAFTNAVDEHDRVRLWAHFGAYDAGGETWVLVFTMEVEERMLEVM